MQRGKQHPSRQGPAVPAPRSRVPAPRTGPCRCLKAGGDLRSPGFTSSFGTELRGRVSLVPRHPGRENGV